MQSAGQVVGIDGVDLALVDPAWLRRQVTHVMRAAELGGAAE